jgi:hypothetical protein
MKTSIIVAAMALLTGLVYGADESEEGIPTLPLKIYSGGVSIGAVSSLNEELQDVSKQFFKLSFVNNFAVAEHVGLFLDIDCLFPQVNPGASLGVDYIFLSGRVRPFAGFGLGAQYLDHDADFGEDFGISVTGHAGVLFDITDNVALRARIPYEMVLNQSRDHTLGFEGALIFSSRFKHVRKLNYR